MSDSQRAFWEACQKNAIECAVMAPFVFLFFWFGYRSVERWIRLVLAFGTIAGVFLLDLAFNALSIFVAGNGTSSGQPPAQY